MYSNKNTLTPRDIRPNSMWLYTACRVLSARHTFLCETLITREIEALLPPDQVIDVNLDQSEYDNQFRLMYI